MSGSDKIASKHIRTFEKGCKFYKPVADNARVWCPSEGILSDEILFDDAVKNLCTSEFVKFYSICFGTLKCTFYIIVFI